MRARWARRRGADAGKHMEMAMKRGGMITWLKRQEGKVKKRQVSFFEKQRGEGEYRMAARRLSAWFSATRGRGAQATANNERVNSRSLACLIPQYGTSSCGGYGIY